jgi:hypothetical protein
MLAANYVGAISATLTQGKQSLPHLRNEMSKYIRETLAPTADRALKTPGDSEPHNSLLVWFFLCP